MYQNHPCNFVKIKIPSPSHKSYLLKHNLSDTPRTLTIFSLDQCRGFLKMLINTLTVLSYQSIVAVVQLLKYSCWNVSDSLQPHGLHMPGSSFLHTSQTVLKVMSIESMMLSVSSSATPFSFPFNLSQYKGLSQHQSLFQWVCSWHQVAKVLEFQLQHQSFQWIVRVDFL